MNKQLHNIAKGARRDAAVKAGAYDGRFGHRVIADAKKEADRLRCREDIELPAGEVQAQKIQPSPHRR